MLQRAELSGQADSENNLGGSSETMYYIGLDVHKKTISYCVRTQLVMCTVRARSDPPGVSWMRGSERYLSPG